MRNISSTASMSFTYGMWYKAEDPAKREPFWMCMHRDLLYVMPKGGGEIGRCAVHHAKDWRHLGLLDSKDTATAREIYRNFIRPT